MTSDPAKSPGPAPNATSKQGAQEMEWKHFTFAMLLLFGAVLGLPIAGALYVLLVEWGWVASPLLNHAR